MSWANVVAGAQDPLNLTKNTVKIKILLLHYVLKTAYHQSCSHGIKQSVMLWNTVVLHDQQVYKFLTA